MVSPSERVMLYPNSVRESLENLLKKIANSWRGTVLTIDQDSVDFLVAGRKGIVDTIMAENTQFLSRCSDEGGEVLLNKLLQILRCFLSSRSIITSIDQRGFVDLFRLAVQSLEEEFSMKDLEIRIGFGATPTSLPNARLPSYVLGAASILRALRDSNVGNELPRVILYSASKFVQSVNEGDREKIVDASTNNFAFIRAYLREFLPALASQFDFDDDVDIASGSIVDILLDYYAQVLRSSTSFPFEQARNRIIQMGAKYGSAVQDSLRYGVAHTLYAGDLVAGASAARILATSSPKPKHLALIGGEPERIFWRVRQAVMQGANIEDATQYVRSRIDELEFPEISLCELPNASDASETYSRIQFISQAGQFPVYGNYAGDLSIQDVMKLSFEQMLERSCELRIKRDFLAVLCDIADLPAAVAYSFTSVAKLDTSHMEKMASAYKRYAEFCRQYLSNDSSLLQ